MKLNILIIHESLKNKYDDKKESTDSGLDLYCPEDTIIKAHETKLIPLGVKCEPINYNGGYYLFARSSIYKTPLMLANHVGIIDQTYRGEIMAAVRNLSNQDYKVDKFTRLFQLCSPDLSPITFSLVDQLTTTKRNEGGFGSTGK